MAVTRRHLLRSSAASLTLPLLGACASPLAPRAADAIGRASMIARFGRYDMAFGRADADGDGSVTRQELSALGGQSH